MKAIWEDIKRQIRAELSKNTYALWIDPIRFLEATQDAVILNCPNKFSRDWVMENYFELIEWKLKGVGVGQVEMVYKAEAVKDHAEGVGVCAEPKQLTLPSIAGNGTARLRREFTFERFVVGKSNEFAYSASKAFGQGGCLDYRCLLMLANTGLGKSHLSHAIGHAILQRDPCSRVHYMTAEDFTNEMILSLKHNRIEGFKEKYRRCCDVLLLEEVHFLSGKQKTQLELGYVLDALANEDKPIICTSALAPKDIPGMSGELSSRLTAGLVTTIGGPDFDTRVKIIRKKASEQEMLLSEEIIGFLASCLRGDVRQMESALKSLKARGELVNAKIDVNLAKEVVSCLVSEAGSMSLEEICKLVCQYYKVDPVQLESKSRKKVHAMPRNIYVYLSRQHTDETIQQIAKSINRSHAAVVYASELVARSIKTDEKMRRQVNFLSQKLKDMKT